MAIKEIKISRFDGGMIGEDRDFGDGYFKYLENVLVGDKINSIKQTPNTTNTVNDRHIVAMQEVGGTIYGLGWENGGTQDVTVYSGSFNTAFSALTSGTVASTNLRTNSPLFEYYNGVLYFDAGSYVASYTIATNTMNATYSAISGGLKGGAVWQGNIYGWGNTNTKTVYVTNTSTAVTTAMISVPSDQTIVDLIPYGNYLAIICTSTSTTSRMYLWDGVTTTTFADIVDIGYGTVAGADILDGQIYALIAFPNLKGFRLKIYTGSVFKTLLNYDARANSANTLIYCEPASRLKAFTGYLYFLIVGSRPYSTYASIYEMSLFRYGKKDSSKQNTLSVIKSIECTDNLTVGSTLGSVRNDFIVTEKYSTTVSSSFPKQQIVSTILTGASTMTEVKTAIDSNNAVYTSQDGVVETGLYTGADASKEKYLKGISAYFSPLPSGGSVQLFYKKNEDTTWTHIFNETTANAISHEAVNIESTGTILPIFREIAFRAELGGGAELTGLKFKYEEEQNLYG